MSGKLILQQQLSKFRDRLQAEPLEPEVQEAKNQVISWQIERINRAHADLRADAKTRPTVEFFLKEVYSVRDFRDRDVQLERVSRILSRILPESALLYLAQVLEMNLLTEELDTRMAHVIAPLPEFNSADFEPSIWAEVCRRCDDEAQRRRLVQLIWDGGKRLDSISRNRALGLAIRVGRRPSELAGLGELYRIMRQGYDAFRELPDCDAFLKILVGRETQVLDEIWSKSSV
ncbi:MAG: hypothetical protein ACI8UO_003798 [Verrucomicrobiales bacterium]|jgi:hypothetical protein